MATKRAERRKARKGATQASATSLEKDMRASLKTGADIGAAKMVGKLVAERAAAAGVKDVVFDRDGYLDHGHVRRWPTLRTKAN